MNHGVYESRGLQVCVSPITSNKVINMVCTIYNVLYLYLYSYIIVDDIPTLICLQTEIFFHECAVTSFNNIV